MTFKPNFKAALIHLGLSAIVSIVIVYLVFGLWYAPPWASALGVTDIFVIILAVDLCLGPLLTAVVYKEGKASLRFDLTVIVCLQVVALAYGMYTVASSRPAYLVFSKDRFDLVQASEVVRLSGTKDTPAVESLSPWAQPWLGAQTIAAQIPASTPENYPLLNALTASAMGGGPDVPNVVDFHREYATALPLIFKRGVLLHTQTAKRLVDEKELSALKERYPLGTLVVPVKVKFTVHTAMVEPTTGRLLGVAPINLF